MSQMMNYGIIKSGTIIHQKEDIMQLFSLVILTLPSHCAPGASCNGFDGDGVSSWDLIGIGIFVTALVIAIIFFENLSRSRGKRRSE